MKGLIKKERETTFWPGFCCGLGLLFVVVSFCDVFCLRIVVQCVYFSLLQYAQETQHEKILRGLAVGIALTMYGRLEEADPLITSLCQDKDPILRRSGMYTLAMAYCGTGNNQAIRKLLHVAVSVSICVGLFFCFLYTVH